MNPLPDPFTPLSSETITRLYHKRLEPFTVKGDVKQIFREHKEGKHPGQIEKWKTYSEKTNGHVVFKPETIEGLEKWNKAHDYHYGLSVLQNLQFKYKEALSLADKNREKQSEANEIKAEIITLYNRLFGEPEPLLTVEALETVYTILKDYFSEHDQSHLKAFLAGVKPPEPITFNSNGNKFADAFKKLYRDNFITGWQLNEIQTFIIENIRYVYRGKTKKFEPGTIENYFSSPHHECKNPLLRVEYGKIEVC